MGEPRKIKLFNEMKFDEWLNLYRQALSKETRSFSGNPSDEIEIGQFVSYLTEKYRIVSLPELRESKQADSYETEGYQEYNMGAGRIGRTSFKQITTKVHIFFSGDGAFFTMEPPQLSVQEIDVELHEKHISLEISFPLSGLNRRSFSEVVLEEGNEFREILMQCINRMKGAVDYFNKQELAYTIKSLLQERLKELELVHTARRSPAFPLLERQDPPQLYQIPEQPAVLETVAPAQKSNDYSLELSQATYERIIEIMSSMSRVMEYSPDAFAHLNEEQIRMHFVLMLNGHFIGKVTPESFVLGHTDILINEGDLAIFVAECKIWKGEKKLKEAINQLLGYLTWRENKTALLIFLKSAQPSDIKDKIRVALDTHSNRVGSVTQTTVGHLRCKFTHPKDKGKSVLITVMLFDVRTSKKRSDAE